MQGEIAGSSAPAQVLTATEGAGADACLSPLLWLLLESVSLRKVRFLSNHSPSQASRLTAAGWPHQLDSSTTVSES